MYLRTSVAAVYIEKNLRQRYISLTALDMCLP
jgi:hypothetical protein